MRMVWSFLRKNGFEILPKDRFEEADAIIVRSATKVNRGIFGKV